MHGGVTNVRGEQQARRGLRRVCVLPRIGGKADNADTIRVSNFARRTRGLHTRLFFARLFFARLFFARLFFALLSCCAPAPALNPALDVSQYAHASWKYRDGFTKGIIYDVAQTPDGWLWLATEYGLARFDGAKAVAWEPPHNQALPSNNVRKLFVDRSGTLWISTINGFAAWKNGKVTQYPDFNGFAVGRSI